MNCGRRNNKRGWNRFRLRCFSDRSRRRELLKRPIRFGWCRRRDHCSRSLELLFFNDARWDRSGCPGGRFDLPLQFQQVATQSIAHLHAQVGEFEESLAKFVLLPQEIDGDEGRGKRKYPEHYEYELHERHSPVCT
jgi:hypothetical protein